MENVKENLFKSSKQIFLASLVAIIWTLILIIAFAVVLKLSGLNESIISPINITIKIISLYMASRILVKNIESNLIIKSLFVGILYSLIAFIIFSIFNKNFSFNINMINDLLFGALFGGISAVLAKLTTSKY